MGKLIIKDLIIIILFAIIWTIIYKNTEGKLNDIIMHVPNFLFISLGYYAVVKVSYNIINIYNKFFYF
jgi:hypothetical protein